ncbi:hypothetical protein MMC2321_01906 [Chitinophaga sp. MM2321]
MIWYVLIIPAAVIVLIAFIVTNYFFRINKEHVRFNKTSGQPYCKSCVHSYCSCGLGGDYEPDERGGWGKKVRGKDDLPEVEKELKNTTKQL